MMILWSWWVPAYLRRWLYRLVSMRNHWSWQLAGSTRMEDIGRRKALTGWIGLWKMCKFLRYHPRLLGRIGSMSLSSSLWNWIARGRLKIIRNRWKNSCRWMRVNLRDNWLCGCSIMRWRKSNNNELIVWIYSLSAHYIHTSINLNDKDYKIYNKERKR
jgi:hypothetical protein